jgi:hypothetical protein
VSVESWSARPNTILVDSQELESDEGTSPEFKKIAAVEIDEFKAAYRARFPGRSADELRDEDLLREVMNTVGKAGKLGERVRCVVSVSMLTEGWDANTVTHILGVRAFSTQLLCEKVVGRGLRRMSYAVNDQGLRYVKNQSLGFTIPYTLNGEEKQYYPDFIACFEDRRGLDDGRSAGLQACLNLIIEVTGEARKDKAAKVTTARTL